MAENVPVASEVFAGLPAAAPDAESLRQSTQAIDDLTHTANGLRTGVSRFKVAT